MWFYKSVFNRSSMGTEFPGSSYVPAHSLSMDYNTCMMNINENANKQNLTQFS